MQSNWAGKRFSIYENVEMVQGRSVSGWDKTAFTAVATAGKPPLQTTGDYGNYSSIVISEKSNSISKENDAHQKASETSNVMLTPLLNNSMRETQRTEIDLDAIDANRVSIINDTDYIRHEDAPGKYVDYFEKVN